MRTIETLNYIWHSPRGFINGIAFKLFITSKSGRKTLPYLGRYNRPVVLKLEHVLELPERLVKHRFEGLTPRLSDSVVYGQGQGICISHKFPGIADMAGPRSPLSEILP